MTAHLKVELVLHALSIRYRLLCVGQRLLARPTHNVPRAPMEVEPDVIDVPMVEAQLEAAPVPPPAAQVRTRAEQE